MQSGITAASELLTAFNALVSSDGQRALFAEIENERLVPNGTIPFQHDELARDLAQLDARLAEDRAAYILLKTHPGQPNGFVAITYVPNAAPVRQKMLFASTRLTLVRELGIERFRDTLFCTEKQELSAAGWAKHEAHENLAAPLTVEEKGLQGVKDAEAAEAQGTSGRRGHVGTKVDVKTSEGVVEAVGLLREDGCKGTMVQLKYELPGEILTLDSCTDGVQPEDVTRSISTSEPRYSFYSHPRVSGSEPEIWFMYTCPGRSKIKERMIYSTGKTWVRSLAERDARISISHSLEATEPEDLALDLKVSQEGGAPTVSGDSKSIRAAGGGFARPKRAGRR